MTILSVLIIILTLATESLMPGGVFISVGYVIAIIFNVYSQSRIGAIISSLVALGAILIAVLFLHRGENTLTVVLSHSFSAIGVLISLFFVMYVNNLQRNAEKDSKQLELLFNNATEGIVVVNEKGEIVLANPHAETMFGYDKGELNGKNIEILVVAGLQGKSEQPRVPSSQHPLTTLVGTSPDLFAIKKHRVVFPIEISLSSYTLGERQYVTAFIIDVSVRKKGMEQLQKANEEIRKLNITLDQKVKDRTIALHETLTQLEQSKHELSIALEKEKEVSDLKSRFVSTVSHEFRTPLSTILTSASLINGYTKAEEQQKRERHIMRIEESVSHMNSMLEDLLSLGKLEEGLIEIKAEEFELHKFLEDFIAEMNETNKRGQKIICNDTWGTVVATDKRLLKSILLNLISNAVKFSPDNSTIEMSATYDNDILRMSVKDSGIGISAEDQKHLFERFFRAQNAVNIKGTGLGLHIVTKYLELLKGNISLQSELNKGTTFIIQIPKSNVYEEDISYRR